MDLARSVDDTMTIAEAVEKVVRPQTQVRVNCVTVAAGGLHIRMYPCLAPNPFDPPCPCFILTYFSELLRNLSGVPLLLLRRGACAPHRQAAVLHLPHLEQEGRRKLQACQGDSLQAAAHAVEWSCSRLYCTRQTFLSLPLVCDLMTILAHFQPAAYAPQ